MMKTRILRSVVVISILAAGLAGPVPAQAASVKIKDVSLQVAASQDQRTLVWQSKNSTAESVEFGIATGAGFPSKTTTVKASKHASSAESGWYYNAATITGINAATRYAYRIGSAEAGWSAPTTFATADSTDFGFWVFGDPQLTQDKAAVAGWQKTLAVAEKNHPNPALMITVGDQVNATSNASQYPEWDVFFSPNQLRSVALSTTLGNHDQGRRTKSYAEHTMMPNQSKYCATSTGSSDYWFTYNSVLFLNLNSNCHDTDEHAKFLAETLADQQSATWRVVTFHHALFSAAEHVNDSDVAELRENLAPILSKNGINVVFNGHDHDFVRSYLMAGAAPVAGTGGSTVHPSAGQTLYIAANSSSGSKFYDLSGSYEWAAVANQDNVPNYTNVQVSKDTLRITTVRSGDGSTVDDVTVHQQS